jgi:hypothetical protein
MPSKLRKLFVRHPNAILFLLISAQEFFNRHSLFRSIGALFHGALTAITPHPGLENYLFLTFGIR